MKRERPGSLEHTNKGTIAHILNPVHSAGSEMHAFTGVGHSARSKLGYGVYFGLNDARNEYGVSQSDKSAYRSELRAILRCLQRIASNLPDDRTESWVVNTSHEYSVRRIMGNSDEQVRGPKRRNSSHHDISAEVNHTPCMDLVMQVREMMRYVEERNHNVRIKFVNRSLPDAQRALELARLGAESGSHNADPLHLEFYAQVGEDEFQQVFTDGSTVLNDGVPVAGYGVYFGPYDPRNECGTVTGSGTGPRGSLAGILRAIVAIADSGLGHKRWEVVSCRGQYIESIFTLSAEWQRNGWRRSAGKPIASLDIYRAARRLLDDLAAKGFEVRGTYIPQKSHNHRLMVADIMARRGAGDTTIEIPETPTVNIGILTAPEDSITKVVRTFVFPVANSMTSWQASFGHNDPRNIKGSIPESRDPKAPALQAIAKVLRIIESEQERNWVIESNNDELVQLLSAPPVVPANGERKQRVQRIEPLSTCLKRLQRHGYVISFAYNPNSGEEKQEDSNHVKEEPSKRKHGRLTSPPSSPSSIKDNIELIKVAPASPPVSVKDSTELVATQLLQVKNERGPNSSKDTELVSSASPPASVLESTELVSTEKIFHDGEISPKTSI